MVGGWGEINRLGKKGGRGGEEGGSGSTITGEIEQVK